MPSSPASWATTTRCPAGWTATAVLRLPDGRGLHARGIGTLGAGAAAQLCVRPERLHLSGRRRPRNRLAATVLDAIHQGDHWRVVARLQGLEATWFAKLAPRELPRPPAPGASPSRSASATTMRGCSRPDLPT
jgi:hypothetical protein